MALQTPPLWLSLRRFQFDDPAHAVPFSTRLRREQGWSSDFTTRVLDEYRRFLLLTATHGELMVPSEAVDQAWHLHMLDTRAYWDHLCGRVVGAPLHHTPSRGGDAEDARHADAYEATLQRYRQVFGEAPPADIWPPASERFAARYRRIDTRDAWVVRKSMVKRAGLGATALAVLAGCAKATSVAVTALVLAGLVFGMFALIAAAAAHTRVRDDKSPRNSSCGGSSSVGCGCDGGGGGGGCGGGGCGGGCG